MKKGWVVGEFSWHKPMHDRLHTQADRLKEVKALKNRFIAFSLSAFFLFSTTSTMHWIIVSFPRLWRVFTSNFRSAPLRGTDTANYAMLKEIKEFREHLFLFKTNVLYNCNQLFLAKLYHSPWLFPCVLLLLFFQTHNVILLPLSAI